MKIHRQQHRQDIEREYRRKQLPGKRKSNPILIFTAILLVAWVVVYAASKPGSAAIVHERGAEAPSPLPTVSPLPIPAPILNSANPNAGLANKPNQVTLRGKHFQPGAVAVITLESSGQKEKPSTASATTASATTASATIASVTIELATTFVDSALLSAKVPANIAIGLYSIQVINPDEQKSGVLSTAYEALDPTLSGATDLSSLAQSLWAIPHAPIAGQATTIGLIVYRLGGSAELLPVSVDFYADEIKPEKLIGRGTIAAIGPDSSMSTVTVPWTPPLYGKTVLFAVIDPDDQLVESNEQNNTVSRALDIRYVVPADIGLPVAQQLLVNSGEDQVASSSISLTTTAVDPDPNASGVLKSYMVELEWVSGLSGGGWWIPIKWSGWSSFVSAADPFLLVPNSGVRYLQSWVADRAGNISDQPTTQRVNYVPPQDSLLEGEIRVFRRTLLARQCLRVGTTPASPEMDPDIYIWPPDFAGGGSAITSTLPAGQTDQVIIQPTQSGDYQIEIVAATDATFAQSIEVLATCATIRTDSPSTIQADKRPRTEPFMPLTNAPVGDETTPDTDSYFLNLISTVFQKTVASTDGNQKIYLPAVHR